MGYITFNFQGHRYSVNSNTRQFMVHKPNMIGIIRENIPVPTKEQLLIHFNGKDVLHENDALEKLLPKDKEFRKLLNYVDYWRRTEGKMIIFAQAICKQANNINHDNLTHLTYGNNATNQ